MHSFDDFHQLFSSPQRVAVIPHLSPDADALGSSLALSHFLRKKGHQTTVVSPTAYPAFLAWMDEEQAIVIADKEAQKALEAVNEADVLVFVDFSSYNRLKSLEAPVRKSKAKRMVIDHHLNPDIEADFQVWDVKASATAQLVYDLIEGIGDKALVDNQIAQYIYAGIITDTSSFKHPSTTKRVHLITADLMEAGLDTNLVQRRIYDTNSEARLRFLGFALQNKLTVVPDHYAAYFALSIDELEKHSYQPGDTEGLVNYALSIKDIVIAAMFSESEDGIKISFRSVGDLPVNEIAEKYFNGGGHKNASGGIYHGSLEEATQLFLSILPQYDHTILEQVQIKC